MLLVHIEGFLEVARLGSVSRAADVLYVTQPTLTARLQSLERDMGHELFVRTRHGMRLTDEGRAFLPFAERAVRALRDGHSEEVQQLVLRDEVQLGIGRALKHPDVELIPFHEEELVLVVAPGHPFARRADVQMSDVGSQQVIMFDRASSYYEITQAAFLATCVQTRSMMELDN